MSLWPQFVPTVLFDWIIRLYLTVVIPFLLLYPLPDTYPVFNGYEYFKIILHPTFGRDNAHGAKKSKMGGLQGKEVAVLAAAVFMWQQWFSHPLVVCQIHICGQK